MCDFENLDTQQKALLQIKLDGFMEAATQAARASHIGRSEALSLTMLALLREVVACSVSREHVEALWAAAVEQVYPAMH